MPHRVQQGQCKLFDVCQLPATWAEEEELFCLLHLPIDIKNHPELSLALSEYRKMGRCNFRSMFFPLNFNLSFENHQFTEVADFSHVFCGGLDLSRAHFQRGLIIEGQPVRKLSLRQVTISGAFRLNADRVEGTVDLSQALCRGSVEIEATSSLQLPVWSATFHDTVTISAEVLRDMSWSGATFAKGLKVRGTLGEHRQFNKTTFAGRLDLRACTFLNGLALDQCLFAEDSSLDLTNARVQGSLVIEGPSLLPHEIILDGTRVPAATRIQAALGSRRPRLIARTSPPNFGADVYIGNADLSECRLVGNNFLKMEFGNVGWPRRGGRAVLFDELALRSGDKTLPLSSLREAYQILKEKCRTMGDHVRSGDFHYGEMEIKRREYGWPRRVLSLEFLYWALSGYGVGYIRSLLFLAILVVGFGVLYWIVSPGAFAGDLPEAIRFSLSVAALQRPEVPEAFGPASHWLYVTEAILGPVQIALFVLALRMRLRR